MPRECPMDYVLMTYEEIAERLGIELDSARKLVRRRRWIRNMGNDGRTRIQVPMDYDWDRGRDNTADKSQEAPQPPAENQVHLMIGRLEGEIVGLRQVIDAERRRAEDAIERLAKVEAERDERIARLERERDERLAKAEAERVRLQEERDRWMAKALAPWWRRRAV